MGCFIITVTAAVMDQQFRCILQCHGFCYDISASTYHGVAHVCIIVEHFPDGFEGEIMIQEIWQTLIVIPATRLINWMFSIPLIDGFSLGTFFFGIITMGMLSGFFNGMIHGKDEGNQSGRDNGSGNNDIQRWH